MSKKITTSDIASTLGLSRNTVSKALNNHPSVSEATRRSVMEKAHSLGYGKISRESDMPDMNDNDTMNIAFLIRSTADILNGFWGEVLRGIQEVTRQQGHNMIFYFVQEEDFERMTLPQAITNSNIKGIILAGITNEKYLSAISNNKIPFVLIDCQPNIKANELFFDTVLTEGEQSVYELTGHLIQHGHRQIGFIGDIYDCRTFMERWIGFKLAMSDAALPLDNQSCITAPSPSQYFDYNELSNILDTIEQLPTAFVCANDLIALQVITYLERIGLQVPRDVSVVGFDNMRFNKDLFSSYPKLTTAQVFGDHIGERAMEQLLWRMHHRERPFEFIRITSTTIIGETTGAVRDSASAH